MKKRLFIFIVLLTCIGLLPGCKGEERPKEDIVEEDRLEEDVIGEEKASQDEDLEQIEEEEDKTDLDTADESGKVNFNSLENVFAFADESGKRLISLFLEKDDYMEDYNIGLGNNGQIIEIDYEGYQEANDGDSHRENMYNFDNMPGHIYRAKNGGLAQDTTYFLSKDTIIKEGSVIPLISTSYESLDSQTLAKIVGAKERDIVESNLLSETVEGGKIGLVVFERIDDDMLASIVYVKDDVLIFKDYPAVYDEMSTWRVDGGDHPGLFEVMFLLDSDQGLLLALTWPGPEGENAFILRAIDDKFVETDFMSYRYWSPM